MDARTRSGFELPPPARLAHDLLWARTTLTGRRPRLDDLEEADRLAALLVDRWRPAAHAAEHGGHRRRFRLPRPRRPSAAR